jgi:hypothetical protein
MFVVQLKVPQLLQQRLVSFLLEPLNDRVIAVAGVVENG